MLPILNAEEAMRESERIGVGTGSFEREASLRVLNSWRREAGRGQSPAARPTPDQMAAMGLGYHVVLPETPADG